MPVVVRDASMRAESFEISEKVEVVEDTRGVAEYVYSSC